MAAALWRSEVGLRHEMEVKGLLMAYPALLDAETRDQLPALLGHLPRPVLVEVFGRPADSQVKEALDLGRFLSHNFPAISFAGRPPRTDYSFYPVISVKGRVDDHQTDYGVRIIGLPAGYQMTSLIAAIQSVSFQGMTSEPRTRIALHGLGQDITLELITSAQDEYGPLMAQRVFNMAIVSPHVRSFLIMGDRFPEAVIAYSVGHVPHLVINKTTHLEGVADEATILAHIAMACR